MVMIIDRKRTRTHILLSVTGILPYFSRLAPKTCAAEKRMPNRAASSQLFFSRYKRFSQMVRCSSIIHLISRQFYCQKDTEITDLRLPSGLFFRICRSLLCQFFCSVVSRITYWGAALTEI